VMLKFLHCFALSVRNDDDGYGLLIEVDRISVSVSVSAPNVNKWALSADIRFWPKAVVPHSVHFRFRRAAVGKFGGCRKYGTELELRRQRMRQTQGVSH